MDSSAVPETQPGAAPDNSAPPATAPLPSAPGSPDLPGSPDTPGSPGLPGEVGTPDELPDISGYWPDAPHRAGPPADHYEPAGAEPVRTEPAWRPRASQQPTLELRIKPRKPPRTAGSMWKPATALAVAILVAGGVTWYSARPTRQVAGPVFTEPSAALVPDRPPVSIEASAPDDTEGVPAVATFELADGTTELGVRIGETGSGWFRVTSPADSGIKPRTVVENGAVRVFVETTGRTGSGEIDVVLSPDVSWSVLMRGGVRTASIDLTGGRAGRVDLLGGAAQVDLALPRQAAVVPISMTGGIRDWRISTAGRGPVKAVLQRGAGAVVLYGSRDQGVDKGARFTVNGGTGGIDLIADEGVGTLTVAAGQGGGTIPE